MKKILYFIEIAFLTFQTPTKAINNKRNAIIYPTEEEPAVLQLGELIGQGSNVVEYATKAYQLQVSFTLSDTLRLANFDLYIKPVVTYDYKLYYEPKTYGTYLIVSNYKLRFNYISSFRSMADTGPNPSWINNPINSYVLPGTGQDPQDSYLCLLTNFNYQGESRFNTLPVIMQGKTYFGSISIINETAKIEYMTHFTYITKYYNKSDNTYIDYKSNIIYPYSDTPRRTAEAITLNNDIKEYDIASKKVLSNTKMDAFNTNNTIINNESSDTILIDYEGFKTAYDNGAGQEYSKGYDAGYANGIGQAGEIPWLVSMFNAIDSIFKIEIFPGLKIWYIIAIPIIFSLIAFVLSFFK